MKKSVSIGVMLSAVVCLAYGCGGDDDTTSSSPHAGSAGKGGGSGGKGGAGGSSAKGGKAGQSGSSGRGGTAGAPRGGNSGRGGTAGTSGAGQGGQCDEEQPRAPLAECAPFPTPDGDQGTVQTTCSFEDTCGELGCGNTWSQFDASGCRQPTCTASSQCDDDERCIASSLVGETGCYSSVFEGCEVNECSCTCIASADCRTVAFCQPATDFPEAADCPISTVGCSGLPYFISTLELWTTGVDTDDATDLDTAMLACQTKAERALARCNSHGGEGGGGAGGQSGAGAGGQSGGGVGGH